MILRQLFHASSCSYTYLIANRRSGEATLIDPCSSDVDRYVRLLGKLKTAARDRDRYAPACRSLLGTGRAARANRLRRCDERAHGLPVCVAATRRRRNDRDRRAAVRALATPGHTQDRCASSSTASCSRATRC